MRTARTAAGTLGASLTFALLSNLQLVATETTIDDSDTEQIDYEGGIWNALTGRVCGYCLGGKSPREAADLTNQS